jgi:hypothetical protein
MIVAKGVEARTTAFRKSGHSAGAFPGVMKVRERPEADPKSYPQFGRIVNHYEKMVRLVQCKRFSIASQQLQKIPGVAHANLIV